MFYCLYLDGWEKMAKKISFQKRALCVLLSCGPHLLSSFFAVSQIIKSQKWCFNNPC